LNLDEALRRVEAGAALAREESRAVFAGVLGAGTDPDLLGRFLLALARRGETAGEITGAADALRAAMVPFEHREAAAVDTCGTGGDGLGSFNLSTAAALVAAAAGAKVVKHGNRSVSSRCGSADLLEAAGIPLDLGPEPARAVLEEVGITFLFAPRYHPAMRFAAPVRRSLGVRTIFNFLGPLCNPGRVRRQLLGVGERKRIPDFVKALEALGVERGFVVHGGGGADELTLEEGNLAEPVGDAPGESFEPSALGLPRAGVEALEGGDAACNLALLQGVLDGETGPLRDAVLLNAAAALVAAGVAADAAEGLARGREVLDSGRARRTLADWSRTAASLARGAA